jgi:hypothetical protein
VEGAGRRGDPPDVSANRLYQRRQGIQRRYAGRHGPPFKATLALYNKAVQDKTVTPALSIEQGDNGLPADLTVPTQQLAVELLNGKSDAQTVVRKLDKEYASLK